MPRYFFNTRIGEELIADPEGEVLRDPDSAWEIARAMIRELLKTEGVEADLTLQATDHWRVAANVTAEHAVLTDNPSSPTSTGKHPIDLTEWSGLVDRVGSVDRSVRIGIVGKYVNLPDAYLSVVESLRHAGFHHGAVIEHHDMVGLLYRR